MLEIFPNWRHFWRVFALNPSFQVENLLPFLDSCIYPGFCFCLKLIVYGDVMNTSQEWKSLWPISSVHCPPLLLSPGPSTDAGAGAPDGKEIGPVIFNPSPKPQAHYQLFSSPSLSPHHPPPFHNLSSSRFLRTSSSLLPSDAAAVGSELSSSSSPDQHFTHNSLQLLRCAGLNSVLAFFPTGANGDQIGFVLLYVEESRLIARGDHLKNEVFRSKDALSHRIFKIAVNPLADCDCSSGDLCYTTIGYLLVCTTYSVHWYTVTIRRDGSTIVPGLELLGSKLFKGSAVIHACWSPHLPEESLVLLESGELFMFDLSSCSGTSISSPRLKGKKVKVLWDHSVVSDQGGWLSCEFSWHPRIMIVAHSSVVFLVDSMSEKCNVSCLLKIGVFNADDTVHDRFIAFSIAGPDRFYFTLASNHLVFLCDLRKPMVPLLRWAHNIANPSYIVVSRLSMLRSQSKDVKYSWASDEGYSILLGSFWNCEFSHFCYGPDVRVSDSSDISACSKSFYAWGLPSDLSLANRDCHCGSCLIKEEFSKDVLPGWIDWQQKKEIILGFGIIDEEISSQLFEPDSFGGFSLIKLTSLGNLEAQRYYASWDYSQISNNGHTKQSLGLEDSLLYETANEEFKFRKIYQYIKLDWLKAYLRSNLAQILAKELIGSLDDGSRQKVVSFGQDFHENICQKFKACMSNRSPGSLDIHDVFANICLPTSVYEIALRSLCANLPMSILRMGFLTYSDLLEVLGELKNIPIEFLEVPSLQSELPPFFFHNPSSRSSKWSGKNKPSDSLVGSVVPIPFLVTFHKAHMLKADNLSADSEIELECDKVMQVANEVTGHAVSLADDKEDMFQSSQRSKQFSSYKPVSFSQKLMMRDPIKEDSIYEDERYTILIFRVGKDGKELFDSDCPLKLKFDDHAMNFGPKETKAYKLLKRQYLKFKEGFRMYQDYMSKSDISK